MSMDRRDDSGLTPELIAFIQRAIESIGTLEVLLLMRVRRERSWGAADVSRELRSSPTSASQQLDRLAARGLVRRSGTGADALFVYSPTERDENLVAQLARQYAERKVTIISLIYERRPDDHLKVFSDAFKLRKD